MLDCNHNRIRSLDEVPRLLPPSLLQLSLSHNGLESIQDLRSLAALVRLTQLDLEENPVCASAAQAGIDLRCVLAFFMPTLGVCVRARA